MTVAELRYILAQLPDSANDRAVYLETEDYWAEVDAVLISGPTLTLAETVEHVDRSRRDQVVFP